MDAYVDCFSPGIEVDDVKGISRRGPLPFTSIGLSATEASLGS